MYSRSWRTRRNFACAASAMGHDFLARPRFTLEAGVGRLRSTRFEDCATVRRLPVRAVRPHIPIYRHRSAPAASLRAAPVSHKTDSQSSLDRGAVWSRRNSNLAIDATPSEIGRAHV